MRTVLPQIVELYEIIADTIHTLIKKGMLL